MKNRQLYLVIRASKPRNSFMRSIFYHTRATSKAEAVRNFKERHEREAAPDPQYGAPFAILATDGDLFFV